MSTVLCGCAWRSFVLPCLIRSPSQPASNSARARIAKTRIGCLPKMHQSATGGRPQAKRNPPALHGSPNPAACSGIVAALRRVTHGRGPGAAACWRGELRVMEKPLIFHSGWAAYSMERASKNSVRDPDRDERLIQLHHPCFLRVSKMVLFMHGRKPVD